MSRFRFVFGLVFTIVICDVSIFAQTNEPSQPAALLMRQYETVVYSDATFVLKMGVPDGSDDESENILRLPFIDLMGGLAELNPSAAKDVEKGYKGFFVGAGIFVFPDGFGMVKSRKCYIGIVADGAQPNIASDFANAKRTVIAGQQVWTWTPRPDEGDHNPSPFFASQIGSSYFVMTNTSEDFERIARLLSTTEGVSQPTLNTFSWETFSKHPYWAYRRFRRDAQDPRAAGLSLLTDDVDALAFSADFDSRQSTIRVHTNDNEMKNIPKVFPNSKLSLFRAVQPGVWEASFPLTGDGVAGDALAHLFATFGFGLAL